MHPLLEVYHAALVRQGAKKAAQSFPGRIRPLERWCAWKGIDPATLTAEDGDGLRAWLVDGLRLLDGTRPSRHTLRNSIKVIVAWYGWLVAQGHRQDHPVADLAGTDLSVVDPATTDAGAGVMPDMPAYEALIRTRAEQGERRSVVTLVRKRPSRPRPRIRPLMHPLMETYVAILVAKGLRGTAEKVPARIRPLEQWCAQHTVDPTAASSEQLTAFRTWVCDGYRLPDGTTPADRSLRHILNAARAWYDWLVAAGHRADHPATGVLVWNPHRVRQQGPAHLAGELTDAMTAYLDHLHLRQRPGTARSADLSLRQFAMWCAQQHLDPQRLTRDHADAYLSWLSTTYRSPDGQPLQRITAAARLATLKSWYDWMEVRGIVIANPVQKLRVRVPRSRVVVHEHLSLQEATALMQTQAARVASAVQGSARWAKRYRDLVAIGIGLATGRRIAGLVSLRVDQLDCVRQELRVEREKGRVGRVLPVAEWATAMAQVYLNEAWPVLACAPSVPWLFPGGDGTSHLSGYALGDALKHAVAATIAVNPDLEELPAKTITWHSLRVSFATLLFANGCSIRSVNELMLHRCLSTTARYTPIPIEDMHRIWRTAHPRP